jgi:hypothetical protein
MPATQGGFQEQILFFKGAQQRYLFMLGAPWQHEKAVDLAFESRVWYDGRKTASFQSSPPRRVRAREHRSAGSEPFGKGISHGSRSEKTPFSFLETGFFMVPQKGIRYPEQRRILL